MTRARAALAALAAAVLVAAPAGAEAAPLAKRVKAAVKPLGRGAAVQVTDLSTGKRVVALRAQRRQPLGSTTKLLTAAAALRRLGPETTLGTAVVATAPVVGGVLAGDVVLRGGGDPLLDDAQLSALADGLAGVREITGSVVGEESLFDAARTGPSGDGAFDAELGGTLSALAYQRGAQAPGGPPQPDPARAAAARFDDVLEARGIVIRGVPRAGTAPAGALPVTVAGSRRIKQLVAAMLQPSDDWIAEMLTKGLAAKVHPPPATTAAGAALVRAEAAKLGARVSLVDGSGLDPRDRGTAAGLVAVLRRLRASPSFPAALARPGRPGTLRDRLTSGRARRACRGKTGTLPSGGVSALAGYCTGRNRHTYAFAVLVRGRDTGKARAAQDRVAKALAAAR